MSSVRLTVNYTSDEGEEVVYEQHVTPEGLAAVLTAMDVHAVDED
ncbi:hypothetical protein [Streptomyces sp. NRRL S-378]|nr:hypothetical protein [Streptomyces sp. NRRL S-378]